MDTKEELRKELERLIVEKVEVDKRIAELIRSLRPYIDLRKGEKTTKFVVDGESKAKYEELEKLRKRKTDVERKRKEVFIKYKES